MKLNIKFIITSLIILLTNNCTLLFIVVIHLCQLMATNEKRALEWLHCICAVGFDLDIGCVVEWSYGRDLPKESLDELFERTYSKLFCTFILLSRSGLSFMDSANLVLENNVHLFRMRVE